MKHYYIILAVLCLCFGLSFSNNTLKFIAIVCMSMDQSNELFRHGKRSPTETYPNDPHKDYKWPGGWGQLLPEHYSELYDLGRYFRKVYGNFLPIYSPKEVQVTSSYADRCINSAQLFVAGLFPPANEQIWNKDLLWQPIPVNYEPRQDDNIIAQTKVCPNYKQALKEAYDLKPIQNLNTDYQQLYADLSNETGQNVSTITDVEFLYNTLEIEQLAALPLPEWTKRMYPEPMRFLAMRSLAIFTETELLKRLKAGPFLYNLISHMRNSTSSYKVVLYSGHDITIVNVLRAMGFEKLLKPGFGASLTFELHHNKKGDEIIRILYRDDTEQDPEHLIPVYCKGDCTLPQIAENLKPVLPIDWENECKHGYQFRK